MSNPTVRCVVRRKIGVALPKEAARKRFHAPPWLAVIVLMNNCCSLKPFGCALLMGESSTVVANWLEPLLIWASGASPVGTSLPRMASMTWRIFIEEDLKYLALAMAIIYFIFSASPSWLSLRREP